MPRAKLSNVSLKQLVGELKRRQARLALLLAQREAIRKAIAEHDAIDREIRELQAMGLSSDVEQAPMVTARRGRPPGKPGRKPGRKAKVGRAAGKPLAEYVKAVLAKAGKGLKVREIEAKVLAAGFPTKAKTIYTQIMKVVAKGFKKVSRGVYAMKAGVAAAKAAVAASAKGAPKAKRGRKRGKFSQTAEQFVTGLLKAGPMTSTAINAAWKNAGRGGDANVTLSKMTKAKRLKREKLKEGKGSTYTVA
jgi:hypothetical protein